LTGLVKQIKALRYYPPGHPALRAAAEYSLRGFQPLFRDGGPLSLTVRKEGFLVDDQPLSKTIQVLGQLALFCFARRIQSLVILADLSAADLHRFAKTLNLLPQEIHALGGMPAALERARVTTIWVNELDLATILERKKRLEESPDTSDSGAFEEQTAASPLSPAELQVRELEKLLKQLEQAHYEQQFRHLLQELIPLIRLNLVPDNRWLILRAMALLCQNATGKKFTEARRAHALNAIGQLVNDEMTDFLAAGLTSAEGSDKTRQLLCDMLVFFNDKVVRRLMQLLADEQTFTGRKLLAGVLVRIGLPAVPILQEHLFDERWYVVRNAVKILGEIRSQESVLHLAPLLEHSTHRVRHETVRALSKIGGQEAIDALLKAAVADDQEMRRLAMLSLGAIRAASAIPTLIKLLDQSGWSRRIIDIKKDAIRTLGEIHSAEAVPVLAALLGRRRFLRRALHNELRVVAAAALGEIGEEEARPALAKAAQDRDVTVGRAAAQALLQLTRDSHES
jgi:HEAT repeat protein